MTPDEAQHATLSHQQRETITSDTLRWSDPLQWLKGGWSDMRHCPLVSVSFGVIYTAVAWILGLSFVQKPQYTLMLASTLLLMGPALAMGLIDASRVCEIGDRPRLRPCLVCWWKSRSSLAVFSMLLLVIELIWARSAMLVFALSFPTFEPTGSALQILLDPNNIGFVLTYAAVTALFGTIAFAISAVSVPLMLDKPVDAITAALTSMRACLERPALLLFWGVVITVVTVLSVLPLGLGLMIGWPLIGHASWHAYRGIIKPEVLERFDRPKAEAA